MSRPIRPTFSMSPAEIFREFDTVLFELHMDTDAESGAHNNDPLMMEVMERLHVAPLYDPESNTWYADCPDAQGHNHRGMSSGFRLSIAMAVVEAYKKYEEPVRRRRRRS